MRYLRTLPHLSSLDSNCSGTYAHIIPALNPPKNLLKLNGS